MYILVPELLIVTEEGDSVRHHRPKQEKVMTDHTSLSLKSNPPSIVVTSRQLHIPVFFSSSYKLLINLMSGFLELICTCNTLVKVDLINFYHLTLFQCLTQVHSLVSHVLVYDVTRRETLTNLSDLWAKEVELYSTTQDCVKMLVGNKLDRVRIFTRASFLCLGP